jgi:hypothetical protein
MLALAEAIIRIRFKIDGALRLRCKVGNSRSFLPRKICRGLRCLRAASFGCTTIMMWCGAEIAVPEFEK